MQRKRIKKHHILLLIFALSLCTIGTVESLSISTTNTPSTTTEIASEAPLVDANGNAPFTRIQAAIDHATDGETITIKAGTYTEILEITTPIHLQGEGSDTTHINVVSKQNGYAMKISAENVRIQGLSIKNQGPGLYTTGIKICAPHTTITDCMITATPVGIAIWSSENTIDQCTFIDCDDEGIALLGSSASDCINNVITSCIFTNNCDGIEIQDSSDNRIQHSQFTGNTHAGIDAIGSLNQRNMIMSCEFTKNNAFGIYLAGSTGTTISQCTFTKSTIQILNPSENTISDCDSDTDSFSDSSMKSSQTRASYSASDGLPQDSLTSPQKPVETQAEEPEQSRICLFQGILQKIISRFACLRNILLIIRGL